MTLEKFSTFFCSGFGIGRLKYFPGTIASISVLPIVWVIKENFSLNLFISIIIIYTFFSIFFINHAIKKLKNKDPKFVVVDEHIGQAISLILCVGSSPAFGTDILFNIIFKRIIRLRKI